MHINCNEQILFSAARSNETHHSGVVFSLPIFDVNIIIGYACIAFINSRRIVTITEADECIYVVILKHTEYE